MLAKKDFFLIIFKIIFNCFYSLFLAYLIFLLIKVFRIINKQEEKISRINYLK